MLQLDVACYPLIHSWEGAGDIHGNSGPLFHFEQTHLETPTPTYGCSREQIVIRKKHVAVHPPKLLVVKTHGIVWRAQTKERKKKKKTLPPRQLSTLPSSPLAAKTTSCALAPSATTPVTQRERKKKKKKIKHPRPEEHHRT